MDQHTSTSEQGEEIAVDPAWLARLSAQSDLKVEARFDRPAGTQATAFTFDLNSKAGEAVVAAALGISLKSSGEAWICFDGRPGKQDLGITGSAARTVEIDPALLIDGRLNVAVGGSTCVESAVLQIQSR